jgi:hypothetical protein
MSAGLTDQEKARAAQFIAGTYDLVMESYVDKGDPARPGLTDWMTPQRKFAGDNPHTIYTQAPVDARFAYVLRGRPGNNFYMGLQLYGKAQGFNLPTANLSLPDIALESDGTFVIHIAKERPAGARNWVPLADGDHCFLVRQYFRDRHHIEPSLLHVERIDRGEPTADDYLLRLRLANEMFKEYVLGTIDVCGLLRDNAYNAYPSADASIRAPRYGGSLYPTRDNRYEGFWVKLDKGEAIHLHGFPPRDTPYASYVFYDRWYMTPDYRAVNCFRTADELVLNPDGSFDLYISPEKVDHPNWIDTGGLYEGSYSSRYLMSAETRFPDVRVISVVDGKPAH